MITLGAFSGCIKPTDNESHQGTGTPANWTLTISADRPSISIRQGATDTIKVTVTRNGGFTGPIEFTTPQAPGITSSAVNALTTGTTTTALVIITMSSSFPVGAF